MIWISEILQIWIKLNISNLFIFKLQSGLIKGKNPQHWYNKGFVNRHLHLLGNHKLFCGLFLWATLFKCLLIFLNFDSYVYKIIILIWWNDFLEQDRCLNENLGMIIIYIHNGYGKQEKHNVLNIFLRIHKTKETSKYSRSLNIGFYHQISYPLLHTVIFL